VILFGEWVRAGAALGGVFVFAILVLFALGYWVLHSELKNRKSMESEEQSEVAERPLAGGRSH